MLFNSIDFAIFLPVVFVLYWFFVNKDLKQQNAFLLISSYFFYGWWDWRFLSLIVFSSFVDYFVGRRLRITSDERKRRWLLLSSILVNLGFLGFFKYFNFFAESFSDAFTLFGKSFAPYRLNIILPVGISFYTFQTMSYTIDVYRRRLDPTDDIIAFFAFVSFFPQLVAGPIERASNLLPQFYRHRVFEYDRAIDGMRQILWGLFKKIVIADNCALYVNQIFSDYAHLPGSTLLLGAFFFAFQIYGDFSGYSDIAIGTARLFGFNLMRNFAYPYFSRDIAEFWRRWHISLSSWFRDYVYIPLGGSRGGTFMKIRNTFIIFLVSGFWHGANWTFLAWGFLNACFFLPLMLLNKNRENRGVIASGKIWPGIGAFSKIVMTFMLTTLAWIFFRSPTITDAVKYIQGIFSVSFFEIPQLLSVKMLFDLSMIAFLLTIEWMQREKQHGLEFSGVRLPGQLRWGFYFVIITIIVWFGGQPEAFIYFQF